MSLAITFSYHFPLADNLFFQASLSMGRRLFPGQLCSGYTTEEIDGPPPPIAMNVQLLHREGWDLLRPSLILELKVAQLLLCIYDCKDISYPEVDAL